MEQTSRICDHFLTLNIYPLLSPLVVTTPGCRLLGAASGVYVAGGPLLTRVRERPTGGSPHEALCGAVLRGVQFTGCDLVIDPTTTLHVSSTHKISRICDLVHN